MSTVQIGDKVQVAKGPFVAGRGGFGDTGTVEKISGKIAFVRLDDAGVMSYHLTEIKVTETT